MSDGKVHLAGVGLNQRLCKASSGWITYFMGSTTCEACILLRMLHQGQDDESFPDYYFGPTVAPGDE